jgi:hypothetical protein
MKSTDQEALAGGEPAQESDIEQRRCTANAELPDGQGGLHHLVMDTIVV